jgi:hypothetical protein
MKRILFACVFFIAACLITPMLVVSQSYQPIDNSTAVSVNPSLSITFNQGDVLTLGSDKYFYIEPYDLADITSTRIVLRTQYPGPRGQTIPADSRIQIAGNIITFDLSGLSSTLSDQIEYVVYCSSGALLVNEVVFNGINGTWGVPPSTNDWTFTTERVCSWLGSTSSSWTDNTNWDKPFLNGATVKINGTGSYQPILSGTATVNDLIIEAAGALTVGATANLVISKKLELKSLASDNADLTIIGSVTVDPGRVFIRQTVSATARSYNLSSPVSGATMNSIGGNFQMYEWNGNTGLWVLTSGSSTMETGRGYVLRQSVTAPSLTFSGALNTGTVAKDVFLTASNSAGWNLIGNPFSCAIDFANVTRTSNLEPAFWIYQNLTNLYGAYNTSIGAGVTLLSSMIPSNHAFWVKIKEGTTIPSTETVTMGNACKSNFNNSYLKAAKNEPQYAKVKLAVVSGSVEDEVLIAFADEAKDEVESFDCIKYFTQNNEVIQPFIPVGNKSLAISSYPLFDNGKVVPLSLKVPLVGSYSINRKVIEYVDDAVGVFLDDNKLQTSTDLRTTPSYSFDLEAADIDGNGINSGRFQVRFVGGIATNVDNIGRIAKMAIAAQGNTITISHYGIKDGLFSVYDLKGVHMASNQLSVSGETQLSVKQEGLYIVKVSTKTGIETFKVLISK